MQDKETAPTVSIVVPVLNGESTIESLLESLARLDYEKEKVEVIVVDGNSTDKTRDMVKKYPFRMLTERRNGLNVARNTGIRNSTGDIVAFTDSDCVVPQNWVKKIAENFNDPKIGCVAGNVKGYHNNFFSEYADNSIVRVMPSFERREQTNVMKLFHHPAGCNIAFRREVVEKIGSFDEDIRYGFDDLELVERICKSGYEFVSDPDVIIQHKHRTNLRELLKQHFKYGKGSGFLLRKKGTQDRFSTWALLNLVGFITWISMTGLLTFLTLTTGWVIFGLALFGVTLLPMLMVMVFYLNKAREDGRYGRAIVYPFIDLCRGFTFCVGQIYQLFKANEKH